MRALQLDPRSRVFEYQSLEPSPHQEGTKVET